MKIKAECSAIMKLTPEEETKLNELRHTRTGMSWGSAEHGIPQLSKDEPHFDGVPIVIKDFVPFINYCHSKDKATLKEKMHNFLAGLLLQGLDQKDIQELFEDSLCDVISDKRDGEMLGKYGG